MRRDVRTLLLVLGSLLLLACIAVAAAVWFAVHNADKWKHQAHDWLESSEEAGRTLDTRGCVDRAIAEYRKAPGMLSLQTQQLWLNGCLSKAKPEYSLCAELRTDWTQDPDFMRKSESPWGQMRKLIAVRQQFCSKQGIARDRNCARFIKAIENYCAKATPDKPLPDSLNGLESEAHPDSLPTN